MNTRKMICQYVDYLNTKTRKSCVTMFVNNTTSDLYKHKNNAAHLQKVFQTASKFWGATYGKRQQIRLKNNLLNLEERVLNQFDDLPSDSTAAIFATNTDAKALMMPIGLKEIVVAADQPHLKPMFLALQRRKPFWVIQCEPKFTRIFWSDGFDLNILKTFSAIKISKIEHNVDLLSRVENLLSWKKFPVIIAGDTSLGNIASVVLLNQNILHERIKSEGISLDSGEIIKQGRVIIEKYTEKMSVKKIESVNRKILEGKTTHKLPEIAKKLQEGKIKSMLIASDVNLWGKIHWTKGEIELHDTQIDAHDYDVLSMIAQRAYHSSVDFDLIPSANMPMNAPAVAVLKDSFYPNVVKKLDFMPTRLFRYPNNHFEQNLTLSA